MISFIMSYFNIDPKPKDFDHPNGYRRAFKIKFATTAEAAAVIKGLLEDAPVEREVTGEQGVVKSVEF